MPTRKKILFIEPSRSAPREDTHINIKLPLGFLYMAGVLEKNSFEVKILDCPLYCRVRRKTSDTTVRIGHTPKQLVDIIKNHEPDIVGVSCAYTMYESDSFEVINTIKSKFKDVLLVVGGAHSSANPEYVLRNKNIDIVVIGEGEETMLEIAKRYSAGGALDNINGTAVMAGNAMKINEPRAYIEDLDVLKPAWHLIDLQTYFNHPDNSFATMRRNAVDIITSRGCPGNCVFCSIHTVWGRKWRGRTPLNVVDELEMLQKKYGAKQFRFQDDNLTLSKDRIIAVCNEIVRRKLDIKWDTPNGIAIWTLNEDVLLKMKQAGCYRITFGIESGCKKTQKYVGKVVNLDRINRIIDYCHKIGLWVCATFIIGFPEETREDIHETEDYILSSKINFPFIYSAQPLQGTRMYTDFKKHNLIKNDFIDFSQMGDTKYDTLHMKAAELNQIRQRLYKKFYMRKTVSYLNPERAYREFLSKIRSIEDLKYVLRMAKAVLFEYQ